jgi:hypothetical protein
LLCLTIDILLLGYQRHKQRVALLATACNGKHFLRMTNPFSRKGIVRYIFRGQTSSPRMTKGISVPFPSKFAGLIR